MKSKIYTAIMALLLTITVTNGSAATSDDKILSKERISTMTDPEKRTRLEEINSRVNEIKGMDKSEMTKADRRALKKELRDMRKEARVMTGGVYLSVGAIIIIILLLILIL